jgi:hypothetical protein
MTWNQSDAVVDLLERGLRACDTRDLAELRRVVIALTGTLDFHYEAAARALALIYDRGVQEAGRGNFALARAICSRILGALTGSAVRGR